ncbi:cytochrome [Thermaerobacter subterraneus]|uniref:Heme/copper-type cytochrome/quinol oxidase, subunit 2 n=1 Tax=Thermaerobacter subterraneus DSM 13965 TaxID=867903 RepID=K6QEV5_9FIRM|nr:cytochrome [Thermaerobacter subterraneus]EKP95431.1 heme/copper-type cytochrome/quinol oxidase, subunit 2 [Thermaerobacter subterraneus DSM 13965]
MNAAERGPAVHAVAGPGSASALEPPPRVWWGPLGRIERVWLIAALIWALVMFAMMWIWPHVGHQNTPIESYRMAPADFKAAAEAFIKEHQVGEEFGVPVVEPEPGGEVYLEAMAYQWRPILRLKRGETYRLYVSSTDLQHGLSIQPLNLNFQVLPGYVYVIELTPQQTGEYAVVCNEYCGVGHHLMSGRLIVVD